MGWESDFFGGVIDYVGDTIEEAVKNPVETVLTGGLNTQVAAGQKAFENYQFRNGGRQALQKASQMEAEAAALAKSDAAKKLAGESMIASIPYASAFGQPNPSLLTQQRPKKTILGSF